MGEMNTIIARRGLPAGPTAPFASANDFGGTFARNLMVAGAGLQDAQKQKDDFLENEAAVNADAALSQARIDWQQKLQDRQDGFTGDPTGFAKNIDKEFQEYAKTRVAAPKTLLEANKIKQGLNHLRASVFSQSQNFEVGERQGQMRANFQQSNANDIAFVENGGDINVARTSIANRLIGADQGGFAGGDVIRLGYDLNQQVNSAKVINLAKTDPAKALELINGNRNTLYAAVEKQESNGNPNAESSKGAIGLYQLMPATARETAAKLGMTDIANMSDAQLKEALKNPDTNKALGQAYLNQLLDRYGNNKVLALAAYNGGMGNVDEWLKTIGDPRTGAIAEEDFIKNIPFGETKNYVQNILGNNPSATGDPYFAELQGQYKDQTARQVEQIHHEWQVGQQASLLQQFSDVGAQLRNGIAVPPDKLVSLQRAQDILGENEGKRYWQQQENLRQSQGGVALLQKTPTEQLAGVIDNYKPPEGQIGYDNQYQVYEIISKAAQLEIQQRQKDPAAVAERNNSQLASMAQDQETYNDPALMQRYNDMLLTEQKGLGIRDPRLLTQARIGDFAARANRAITSKNSTELLGIFQGFTDSYGSYAPMALAELQSSGNLPKGAVGFIALTGKNQALDGQALADGIVNYDAYKQKVGKQYTPMMEEIDKGLEPLFGTMDIEQRAMIREAAERAAMGFSARMNPTEAAQAAVKAFADQYTINGRVRIDNTRFPAEQITPLLDYAQDNIQLARGLFDAVGMVGIDPKKDPGLFGGIAASLTSDRLRNSYFATNELEDGVVLLDEYGQAVTIGGKPVEIKFDDMIKARNSFPVLSEKYNSRPHYGAELHQAQKDYVLSLFGIKK